MIIIMTYGRWGSEPYGTAPNLDAAIRKARRASELDPDNEYVIELDEPGGDSINFKAGRQRGGPSGDPRRARRRRRDPARRPTREQQLVLDRARVHLLTGRRLEIDLPGRRVIYLGSTDAPRADQFWYEHPGGRTYKRTPEEVIQAVLPHVGYTGLAKARVHHR